MISRLIQAWTDNPIEALGDAPGEEAPIRACRVLAYDGNKYLTIEVSGVREQVESGYVYTRKGRRTRWLRGDPFWWRFRLSDGGQLYWVPCISRKQLRALPRSS